MKVGWGQEAVGIRIKNGRNNGKRQEEMKGEIWRKN